jgi:hypothetical protein
LELGIETKIRSKRKINPKWVNDCSAVLNLFFEKFYFKNYPFLIPILISIF